MRRLSSFLLALFFALPAHARTEVIHTRDGRTIEGEPRFEGDELVVVRPDGSEVRIPRSEVERIELDGGEGEEREEMPRGIPREGPAYPPYVPPPAPPAPEVPPGGGRLMLENAGTKSGLYLAGGYQRGLALSAEWQQRLGYYLALAAGVQGSLATNEELVCPTWGATARLYVGLRHRFALEGGFGLNQIAPYLNLPANREATCGEAEINLGPEISGGYQWVSPNGLVIEALGGVAFMTEDSIRRDRADVQPLVQVKVGWLFR